jgi:hypothetical protein
MGFQAIAVRITGVGKGTATVSVRTLDSRTGGFYSTSQTVAKEGIKQFVGQALKDAGKHAEALAVRQVEEEAAMSGKYAVE